MRLDIFKESRGDRVAVQLGAIALLIPSILLGGPRMAQANDAAYLERTVQGVSVQDAESAALLRGDGAGISREVVGVNCQNYQGDEFVNLDCLDEEGEVSNSGLRWQRAEENLLTPPSNNTDGIGAADSEGGELRLRI